MKKLIVNPKKVETIGKKGLGFDDVFGTLFNKVYQTEIEKFKPLVTKEGHIRRFVSNAEPKRVAIQDYAGKELNTAEEAVEYLNQIGFEIYGDKQWAYRLIVNEVKYGRESEFYMETTNDTLVKKIEEALEGIASIEYNKVKRNKNNRSEAVTEPDMTTTQDAQTQGQENSNE